MGSLVAPLVMPVGGDSAAVVDAPPSLGRVFEPNDDDLRSFLGVGIITPFRRNSQDFDAGANEAIVRSEVSQALGVEAAHPDDPDINGELQWEGETGSLFYLLRHQLVDPGLREQANLYAQLALEQLPTVRFKSATIRAADGDTLGNTVPIHVLFEIVSENVEGNEVVLPSELEVDIDVAA